MKRLLLVPFLSLIIRGTSHRKVSRSPVIYRRSTSRGNVFILKSDSRRPGNDESTAGCHLSRATSSLVSDTLLNHFADTFRRQGKKKTRNKKRVQRGYFRGGSSARWTGTERSRARNYVPGNVSPSVVPLVEHYFSKSLSGSRVKRVL